MSSVAKPSGSSLAHADTAPANETPTIEKRFNFWTAFGVAVCTSGAWEGWTASIAQGLAGGGPVCLLWGWVVVSVGIICMSCALAEFICVACMVCWAIVNIFAVQLLHYMNTAILVIHVVGYLIVIGVLAGSTREKHDATFVFTKFQNSTGWDSDFVSCTSNVGLSCFLNCISSSVAMAAGFDLWGAASRAFWSMARDKALPATLAKLHPRWNVPVLANIVLLLPSIIIFMIYIWNTTAFYGIMAGVLVSFQLSYVVPLGINIFYTTWWKRDLAKGPFSMGRFSFPVHVVAFLFGCFMVLFMSFPVNHPATAANMNYASAIIGAISILAILLWIFYGRKYYYGPVQFTATEAEQTESIASKADTGIAELGQP
ncbi:hypothetical protein MY1884_001081 [Beauveria asiatica]